MKQVKNIFFFAIFLFGLQIMAQSDQTIASKSKLAEELIKASDMDTAIQKNVHSGLLIFKKAETQNLTENQKKDLQKAKQKFLKMEPELIQEILEQVKTEIASQFSQDELKYLIQVCQYKPFKRFRAFAASPEFNKILVKSNDKVRKLFTDIKIEI